MREALLTPTPTSEQRLSKWQVATWIAGTALVVAVQAGCSVASSAVEVMTLDQYSAVKHDLPYILRACSGRGSLRYVGVRHTRDSGHESVRAVVEELTRTSPDVVFIEGPVFPPKATLEATVDAYGEPGAVLFISNRREISVQSLDLPFRDEAAEVVAKFGLDRAATFYGLRLVAQELSDDSGADVELLLRGRVIPWLRRNQLVPDDAEPMSAFRSSVSRSLGRDIEWRTVSPSWFDPLASSGGVTNEIARFLVRFRDERFAGILSAQVRLGRRVVAVAGASHVVMQQPAILSRLGCPAPENSGIQLSPSEHSCDSTCRAGAG